MYVCYFPRTRNLANMVCMQGETYRVTAYDSIVAVVEPAGSWIDLKLYVMLFSVHEMLD